MDEKDFADQEPYFSEEELSEEKDRKKKRKHMILEMIFYVVLFIFCIYIIPTYILQRTIVDGQSMENALQDNNNLLVEKISYHFDWLKRFDIVVLYPYGKEKEDYYIKRVIGLPGETIQIVEDTILINGKPLEEHYGKEVITFSGIAYEPLLLKEDEYFVMGDNRNHSQDSRDARIGPIKKENIGGKAFLRIWPLHKFGTID